jgi:hypothetical protein
VIAWETGWGAGLHSRLPVGALPAAASVEPKLLPQLVASAPEQTWPETVARPIFVPGRRPAPTLVAVSAMRKGQFILQGTTVVGPLSIAMLKEIATGKVYRMEKGRDILGMTVAEVAPDRVTLRSGDDSEVVVLMVARGTGAPAAAAAPQSAMPSGPFVSEVSSAPGSPLQAAAVPPPSQRGTPGAAAPAGSAQIGSAAVPVPSGGPVPGGLPAIPPPVATQESAASTPEEILARRRAARRAQPN